MVTIWRQILRGILYSRVLKCVTWQLRYIVFRRRFCCLLFMFLLLTLCWLYVHLFMYICNRTCLYSFYVMTDSHMWISVVYRPQSSNFTRCQRASCAFVFIMLTMISNAVFFESSGKEGNIQNPALVKVGPFQFSLQQVKYLFKSLLCRNYRNWWEKYVMFFVTNRFDTLTSLASNKFKPRKRMCSYSNFLFPVSGLCIVHLCLNCYTSNSGSDLPVQTVKTKTDPRRRHL